MHSKIYFLIISTFLTINFINAQFSNVDIEVDGETLPRNERQDIKELENEISEYFTSYDWFDNPYKINIPIRMNLNAQSVNTSGNDRNFTGQLFVATESGSQQFVEKKIEFIYNTNQSLIHDQTIRPLSTILDFYGYLILAGVMDTYEIYGGEELYEEAKSIASRAQYSEYSSGWDNRLDKLNRILNLSHYRKFKFYFWKIIDLENQNNTEDIPSAINEMLDNLEDVYDVHSIEKYTTQYLNVYKKDIIGLLLDYGTKKQIQKLIKIDSRNSDYYQKRIENYENNSE